MRLTSVLLAAFAAAFAPLVSAAPTVATPVVGDCVTPEWVPTTIVRINPYILTCRTYFLGIHVHTSTVRCQDFTRTTPGHYKCTDIPNEHVDCIGGVNNVIETTQPYKSECEGATGLSIEVGGVEIGIDWWKAVCKTDGPPINAVKTTDSSVPCPDDDDDGDGSGDDQSGGD